MLHLLLAASLVTADTTIAPHIMKSTTNCIGADMCKTASCEVTALGSINDENYHEVISTMAKLLVDERNKNGCKEPSELKLYVRELKDGTRIIMATVRDKGFIT